MGRILVFFLSLAVIAWLAYSQIKSDKPTSAPKQQLDNARQAADRVQDQMRTQAEETERKLE